MCVGRICRFFNGITALALGRRSPAAQPNLPTQPTHPTPVYEPPSIEPVNTQVKALKPHNPNGYAPLYYEVSVYKDATYMVLGKPCSGDATGPPIGENCPRKKMKAIRRTCQRYFRSFSYIWGDCYAPNDATCQILPSGSWGCAFEKVPRVQVSSNKRSAMPFASAKGSLPTINIRPAKSEHTEPGSPTSIVAPALGDSEDSKSDSSTDVDGVPVVKLAEHNTKQEENKESNQEEEKEEETSSEARKEEDKESDKEDQQTEDKDKDSKETSNAEGEVDVQDVNPERSVAEDSEEIYSGAAYVSASILPVSISVIATVVSIVVA